MNSRIAKSAFPMGMRVGALASRFFFTFVAVFHMSPEEFGVYGMVSSISYVVGQIVGLEAYQVLLRDISQNIESGGSDSHKFFYGRFILVSGLIAFLFGLTTAGVLGWEMETCLLASLVISLEYICTELMRLLVAEGRPDLSLFSVSTRFSLWSYGVPALSYLGVIAGNWSVDFILALWSLCSLFALVFSYPILKLYYSGGRPGFFRWYAGVLRESPRWMVVALCGRFLESGYRIVPGFILGEAVAGKFIFLATLSSVGPTGIKAVVEPFWFSRMVSHREGRGARREFALITIAACLLGAAVTYGAWWWLAQRPNYRPVPGEQVLLLGLLISASALSLSQIPHFKLYASRDDRAIQMISLAVLLFSSVAVVGCSLVWGVIGTVCGLSISSVILLYAKARRSMNIQEF